MRVGAGEGKARVVGTPWSRLFKAPPATVAMGPFLGLVTALVCTSFEIRRVSESGQEDDSDISVAACRAMMALTLRSRSSSS